MESFFGFSSFSRSLLVAQGLLFVTQVSCESRERRYGYSCLPSSKHALPSGKTCSPFLPFLRSSFASRSGPSGSFSQISHSIPPTPINPPHHLLGLPLRTLDGSAVTASCVCVCVRMSNPVPKGPTHGNIFNVQSEQGVPGMRTGLAPTKTPVLHL